MLNMNLTRCSIVSADDYQVLSTDYTNYAIEYRCEDRGLFQRRGTVRDSIENLPVD